jgi:Tfp pilus assembly protein PilF
MNRKTDTNLTPEEIRARKVKLAEGGIVFVLVLGLCVYLGIRFADPGGADEAVTAARMAAETPAVETIAAEDAVSDTLTPIDSSVTAPQDVAPAAASDDDPSAGTEPADAVAPAISAAGPEVPPVREILPEVPEVVTYSGAEQAFLAGRHLESAAMFEVYCAEHPGNAWGHYMHGLALWKAGRPADARVALQTALERQPGHLKSLVNLARVELELGDAAAALAGVEAALDEAPDHVPALRVRGRALHELDRTAEAEASYLAALRLKGDDGWTLNNLALLWIEQEQFSAALAPLARASELLPEASVVRNNLGVALERTGHPAAALEQFELAATLGSAPAEESIVRLEQTDWSADAEPVDLAALAASWTVPAAAPADPSATPVESVAAVTFEAADDSAGR